MFRPQNSVSTLGSRVAHQLRSLYSVLQHLSLTDHPGWVHWVALGLTEVQFESVARGTISLLLIRIFPYLSSHWTYPWVYPNRSVQVYLYMLIIQNMICEITHSPMLGWYILVKKRTFGGAMGYSSGRNNSNLNLPSAWPRLFKQFLYYLSYNALSKGLPFGPSITTSKYRRFSSCGWAEMPGAGSTASRSVSCDWIQQIGSSVGVAGRPWRF